MLIDHFLERSADRFPNKTAVVWAGQRWTYRQIDARARHFARLLVAAGLQRGDRVVICADSGLDIIVSLFGVLEAGGAFVIVSPHVRADRLSYVVRDSGAFALIGRPRPETSLLPDAGLVRFDAPPDASRATGHSLPSGRSDADLAALVYTSGSTGTPKGVMLTHRNMTAAAAAIGTYLDNRSDDVILNALPLSFTYGLGQVTTAFRSGATLVLEPSFIYPQSVIDTMLREQVTGLPLVPTMATLLLQQDLKRYRFPHLRYITNAAAALSTPKILRIREAFPSAQLYSMYGLTECQRVSYLPPDQIEARPTSVGIAIPGTSVYIVDEHDRRVSRGAVGELVVQGPHVMAGYWNDPEATRTALRPGRRPGETVLYTGDLFRMDDAGCLHFVERKDDIIKTRGEKVAPRQVEEVIARLPGVAEVAVFGVPDDLLGEAVAAAITLVSGARLTRERVRQHCRRHLDEFMVPKVVDIRDTVPTTLTGKVSRRRLRTMAEHAEGSSA